MTDVGVVVIGRNEGPRLGTCLRAVLAQSRTVVYVDSASTDDSVAIARSAGVDVVELDTRERLSAARGRNAGARYLRERHPDLDLVQFVDGDTELAEGWLDAARDVLRSNSTISVVTGRLREQHPEVSVYNALCEMEWAQAPGDVDWCGGIAMMRLGPFLAVGGFDASLIAGEEPDLSVRLRERGHRIYCLARDMAFHDAAMTRFSQWWQRNVRAGHAYREATVRRPEHPAMDAWEQVRSVALWGIVLPVATVALAAPTLGVSLWAPAAGYSLLGLRVYRHMRKRGFASADARLYARYCVLGKLPQAYGMVRYEALRIRGKTSELIEHKRPT